MTPWPLLLYSSPTRGRSDPDFQGVGISHLLRGHSKRAGKEIADLGSQSNGTVAAGPLHALRMIVGRWVQAFSPWLSMMVDYRRILISHKTEKKRWESMSVGRAEKRTQRAVKIQGVYRTIIGATTVPSL